MKITYDKEADALYIRLVEGEYQCRVDRPTDDIALDIAANEKLVGIEILGVSRLVDEPGGSNRHVRYDPQRDSLTVIL